MSFYRCFDRLLGSWIINELGNPVLPLVMLRFCWQSSTKFLFLTSWPKNHTIPLTDNSLPLSWHIFKCLDLPLEHSCKMVDFSSSITANVESDLAAFLQIISARNHRVMKKGKSPWVGACFSSIGFVPQHRSRPCYFWCEISRAKTQRGHVHLIKWI